jgi:transposase
MAVSDDLRERVVEAVVLGGLSRNQAAARFKVSVASAVRWVKRFYLPAYSPDMNPIEKAQDDRILL